MCAHNRPLHIRLKRTSQVITLFEQYERRSLRLHDGRAPFHRYPKARAWALGRGLPSQRHDMTSGVFTACIGATMWPVPCRVFTLSAPPTKTTMCAIM